MQKLINRLPKGMASWHGVNSVLLFAVFAALWTPQYSLAIKLFLASSLLSLWHRPWQGLLPKEAVFLWALLAMTAYLVARDSVAAGAFEPKLLYWLVLVPVWLNLRRHSADPRWLAAGVAIGGVAAGLTSWVVSEGLVIRIGMGRNAISYAGTMLVYVALSLFFLWRRPLWGRPLWAVVLLASLLALMSAGTRGAYVSLLLMGAVLIWPLMRAGKGWGLIWLAAALGALAWGLVESGRWQHTMRELQVLSAGSLETSIGVRLQLWQTAWHVWLDHPWFGFGPDKMLMQGAYADWLQKQGFETELIGRRSHMHNQYFDLLAKYGVVGLCVWLAWLWSIWHGARGEGRLLALLVLLAFMGLALTESILGTNALRYALLAGIMAVFSLPVLWCNTGLSSGLRSE